MSSDTKTCRFPSSGEYVRPSGGYQSRRRCACTMQICALRVYRTVLTELYSLELKTDADNVPENPTKRYLCVYSHASSVQSVIWACEPSKRNVLLIMIKTHIPCHRCQARRLPDWSRLRDRKTVVNLKWSDFSLKGS
jgi:hypothetical protein